MGDSEIPQPRVCIVGAGVSGLCACRHLLKQGIRPTVLELGSAIGGVWRTNCLSITKLQTPSVAYQFSDFYWPKNTPELATGSQVLHYFQAYADHFHVTECIRFNCKVLQIQESPSGHGWNLLIEQDESTHQVLEYDFVILCVGRFGDIPRLPLFPFGKGPEVFKGNVMHSTEYAALENPSKFLSGKKVVVVGFSKSALDVAAEAVVANKDPTHEVLPCTLLFRRSHWILQTWKVFGIPLPYLVGTRFFEMLVSSKPGQGLISNLFSSILFPMKWGVSKFIEVYIRWSLPLSKYGLIPSVSFYEQLSSCKVSLLPDNFFDYVDHNRISLCKASDWYFTEKGVHVNSDKEVEADVVLMCTGFQGDLKLQSLLPKKYAKILQGPDGVAPLYRGVIHPWIPDMAILGYQEDVSNVRSSELGARWLACLLRGKFKLPAAEVMEKSAVSWLQHMKRSTPYYERACVSTSRIWHSDELCRDMGWSPYRKKNWFQELFAPYSNLDYKD